MNCPGCDASLLDDDPFCEACGHDLSGAPVDRCVSCTAAAIDADGYCERCGLRQPMPRDRMEQKLGPMAAVSDKGLRHHRNEDAFVLVAPEGFRGAIVCDGVSSTVGADAASRAAVEAAAAELDRVARRPSAPATAEPPAASAPAKRPDLAEASSHRISGIGRACEAADIGSALEEASRAAAAAAGTAVAKLARSDDEVPSCTYVSALVTADEVVVAWLGDCRAYWLAQTGSVLLTMDDSWATEMVTSGMMSAEDAYADKRAHAITRWLGADAEDIEPHLTTFTPPGPGRVLLCSDGLWNYLADPGALALAVVGDPLDAARALTRIALDSGGHDNITVALIPFPLEQP